MYVICQLAKNITISLSNLARIDHTPTQWNAKNTLHARDPKKKTNGNLSFLDLKNGQLTFLIKKENNH